MEYSNHCAVYGIRYFNVIFCLLAATEMDVYKAAEAFSAQKHLH